MKRNKNRKGELLIENIVFIVLNVAFLSILTIFLMNQGSSGSLLEDAYSKNIALLVDSAKPGMIMKVNMEKGMEIAKKKGVDFADVVRVGNRTITVSLEDGKGKTYEYFQTYYVKACPDTDDENKYNGLYTIFVSREKLSEGCF